MQDSMKTIRCKYQTTYFKLFLPVSDVLWYFLSCSPSYRILLCPVLSYPIISIPVRMANITKNTNGEKGPLIHCWWECKLVKPLQKTVWRCLKKLKTELSHDPAFALLHIFLKKLKTLFKKKNICLHAGNVHSSIIYICQDIEAT